SGRRQEEQPDGNRHRHGDSAHATGPENSPSSPIATSAEKVSARIPSPSESHSRPSPRTNGTRLQKPLYSDELIGSSRITISPFGARTASATCRLPRIITPSIIAWPP